MGKKYEKYTKKEYDDLKRHLERLFDAAILKVRETAPDANVQYKVSRDMDGDVEVEICVALVGSADEPIYTPYWPFMLCTGFHPDDDHWPKIAEELLQQTKLALGIFHERYLGHKELRSWKR